MDEGVIEDVCSASAAYAFNVLPEILKLDPPAAFRRLYDLFHTTFVAYREAKGGWVPEPSDN